MTVEFARTQQRLATEQYKRDKGTLTEIWWADWFTEELFLEGAFERAGLREFCDDAEIHVSFGDSGKLTLSAEEVDHAR